MIEIEKIHTNIISAIKDEFGESLDTVDSYIPNRSAPIDTPAALLELESMEEGDDIGDGRIPVACSFTVHCILGVGTPNISLQVRLFAAQVLKLVRRNKWGLGKGASLVEQVSAGPGEFNQGKNGYESWYVTWDQTVYVGDSVWDGAALPKLTIFSAPAPDVGASNVANYDVIN